MADQKRPRSSPGEGSVTQYKDGRWCVRLMVDGKRKVAYAKTEAEGKRLLRTWLSERDRGRLAAGPNQTLADYLSRWLAEVVAHTVRPKTLENYSRVVRVHVLPSLGKKRLQRLSAQDLAGLYSRLLDGGLSPSSVGVVHRVIHRALTQAERWDLVGRNVADLVDPPRAPHREMQALTAEQCGRFLAAASKERLYALYALALGTGMRQSELLGLRWLDVDLDDGAVTVRQQLTRIPHKGYSFSEPKSARSRRTLALPSFVVAALREHRKRQLEERLIAGSEWRDLGLVFTNAFGAPLEATNLIKRSYAPLLERAGLPRIRFHDLRHTAATLLLSQGENIKLVAEQLGHADVALTLRVYGHVLPHQQRAAATKLDALLGPRQELASELASNGVRPSRD